MSRATINAAEVRAAFEKLLAQGMEPNPQNIRELLQKGGVATIQKHIEGIIQESKQDLLSGLQASEPAAAPIPAPTPAPKPVASSVTVEIKPALTAEPTPAPTAAPAPSIEKSTPQPKQNHNGQVQAQKRPQFQVKKPQQQQQRREPHQNQNQNQNQHHSHNHHNNQNHNPYPNQNHDIDYEPTPEAPLESLTAEALIIKIRRLESTLLKEQARRESAEKIALETKDYADMVKEQVAHRINDLRQNMDLVIEQLKTQLRDQKQTYADDLKTYQEQINKANQSLLTN